MVVIVSGPGGQYLVMLVSGSDWLCVRDCQWFRWSVCLVMSVCDCQWLWWSVCLVMSASGSDC